MNNVTFKREYIIFRAHGFRPIKSAYRALRNVITWRRMTRDARSLNKGDL